GRGVAEIAEADREAGQEAGRTRACRLNRAGYSTTIAKRRGESLGASIFTDKKKAPQCGALMKLFPLPIAYLAPCSIQARTKPTCSLVSGAILALLPLGGMNMSSSS